MATLNLTPSEFADVSVMFLFDKILHPDEIVTSNEKFNKFADDIKGKGIKAPLTNYYMKSDSETRLNYKRIKDIFDGTTDSIQQIRIGPEKEVKGKGVEKKGKEKKGIAARLKKFGKKILKKLIAQGPESLSADERLLLVEMMDYIDKNEGGEII